MFDRLTLLDAFQARSARSSAADRSSERAAHIQARCAQLGSRSPGTRPPSASAPGPARHGLMAPGSAGLAFCPAGAPAAPAGVPAEPRRAR